MRQGDELTFGGSGLDRAQHLRSDPQALAAARRNGRILPVWRGRPAHGPDGLVWLAQDHPALSSTLGEPVFLGLDGDMPCFAADISAWAPSEPAPQAGFFDQTLQPHPDLPENQGFADLRGIMTTLSPREAELAATAKAILEWHRTHGFCAACGAASLPVQGGWQRHCPACNAMHFPRTDPVVIMLVTRGNRVLLGRNAAWPEGMYSLLAGFMEPGETVAAAVRREVFEESGVRCGAVSYVASQPWPFPASLMLGCHAQAETEEITLDPVELEDARWVSREEMVSVMAGLHPDINPPRKGAIAQYIVSLWLADTLE